MSQFWKVYLPVETGVSAKHFWRRTENTGVDIAFYNLRERDLDEILPWDFINIGVTKKFLQREWKNALEGKVTPNCRMQCSGCGAAIYGGGVCFEGKN